MHSAKRPVRYLSYPFTQWATSDNCAPSCTKACSLSLKTELIQACAQSCPVRFYDLLFYFIYNSLSRPVPLLPSRLHLSNRALLSVNRPELLHALLHTLPRLFKCRWEDDYDRRDGARRTTNIVRLHRPLRALLYVHPNVPPLAPLLPVYHRAPPSALQPASIRVAVIKSVAASAWVPWREIENTKWQISSPSPFLLRLNKRPVANPPVAKAVFHYVRMYVVIVCKFWFKNSKLWWSF